MRHYLNNLHKTFYDSCFYWTLAKKWTGIGLGFLIIVSTLNVFTTAIESYQPYLKIKEVFPQTILALPEIESKNGKFTVAANKPVLVPLIDPEPTNRTYSVLFDTSQELTDRDATMKKMQNERLITILYSNAFVLYSPGDGQMEVRMANEIQDGKMTRENWEKLAKILESPFLPFVAGLLAFIFLLLSHIISAFLGAIVIFVVSPLFKISIDVGAAMRIASAAKVPVACVFLIVTPFQTAQILLWFGFAVFGLFSVKQGCKIDGEASPPNGLA
jgi:hypothetical protein